MRGLFANILLITATINAFSQVANPEFTNVLKRWDKGKFESALETAEALIDNDKHKKKAEPYLWASMCYYEISKSEDEKVLSRIKAPMRNALKYAGKAISKDDDGSIQKDNAEFFELMKSEGVKVAQSQDAEGDYRKASYTYKQIIKFAPNDPFVLFAKSIVDIKMNSYFEAERGIQESFPVIEQNYRNLEYEPDPISSPLLKPSVMYYIDHLVENSYTDSARNVALSARVFFPLDEDLKTRVQSLE